MTSSQYNSTTFALLRHGETIWNREKRIQGSGNSVLTPDGIISCRKWAHYLAGDSFQWNRIIASPLQRAQDTANIINEVLKLPIHINYDLREQNWGDWEGLTIAQIKNDYPSELEKQVNNGWDFRPPEGENRREVLKRTREALKHEAVKWSGEQLLVITHLGIIKTIVYDIEGRNFMPDEPDVAHKNCLYRITYNSDNFSIMEKTSRIPDTL